MLHFIEADPNTMLLVDEQLARTFQCAANIEMFFEGFNESYTTSRVIKIPIDEWREFVKLVLKTEKEKMKIRAKRLSEIIEKLS